MEEQKHELKFGIYTVFKVGQFNKDILILKSQVKNQGPKSIFLSVTRYSSSEKKATFFEQTGTCS